MIEIKDNKDCCGCSACVQRCPKQCISLKEDKEGFLYPIVDQETCIDCGLCEKVCPVINQGEQRIPLHVYAAKNKNEEIREQSSSGGIFTLLAENVLAEGGVVFGAKFNEDWEVVHDYTETNEGLAAFRGSKYVQSRIGNTYEQAEIFLKTGRKVLFCGTPCQIAGLKLFLLKEYENLLSVDFVCHGVPSPMVWREYLDQLLVSLKKIDNTTLSKADLKILRQDISKIEFRNKSLGWKRFSFTLALSNKDKHGRKKYDIFSEPLNKNLFLRGFLNNLYLRPSCHACPSKNFKNGNDISLADFWTVERYHSQVPKDNKGISMLLANSTRGLQYLDRLKMDITKWNSTSEIAIQVNPAININLPPHLNRCVFFHQIIQKRIDIIKIISLALEKSTIENTKIFTRRILNRILFEISRI